MARPKVKKRTLVLFKPGESDEPGSPTGVLGTPDEMAGLLAPFNTAVDGSGGKAVGTVRLYGPGFVVEYATGHDEVRQMMVLSNEPEMAWPVLSRMCRVNGWKMQDADSGQVFG